MTLRYFLTVFVVLATIATGIGTAVATNYLKAPASTQAYGTPDEKDTYVRFVMEAFDAIQGNYWMKKDQYELPKYFELALQKLNAHAALSSPDRSGTSKMLAAAFAAASSTEDKKNLAVQSVMLVLYNLQPIARNSLLSHTEEVALRQTVSNINPSKNLYADLGVADGAGQEKIDTAFAQVAENLKASTTPEAKEELKKVTYAHEVLSASSSKSRYDEHKIEPTVFHRVYGSTLYVYFERMAPTTLQEFGEIIESSQQNKGLDSMVLDVRSNIGGSIDFLLAFMGLFLGQNQYVFDVFHQGIYDAQRTTMGQYPAFTRFKDIAVLSDGMTQSTAEIMTASLKRYRLAHVVGVTTRGWGSIENTYPLKTSLDASTTYSLLLVNSLTLRDDNQPVESNGVVPDVPISDPEWRKKLNEYFRSPSLVKTLQIVATKPPSKE